MSALNNFWYRRITNIARLITRAQGLIVRASGSEYIPDRGGAVLVYNHTGYMDFVFGGFLPYTKKRLVRYLTKAGVFSAPGVGPLMRIMGHVPVDRIDGGESMRRAIELAAAGELVGIFPEGTISRSFEIRSMRPGAARIADEAGVPLIPIVMFGSQRVWTKGHKKNLGRSHTPILIKALEPMQPTGDAEADTAELRRRMQAGVESLWADYEAEFGPLPEGAFWVPARKGGAAPTLAEAEAQDLEVEAERHRVRRLRDDLVGLKERVAEATTELVRGRLAITAKPHSAQPARTASENLEWVRENLNSVVEEATRGLDEGREKVAEVVAQLRADAAEAQASLAASGKEIFAGSAVEQGLLAAATQARLILSRLPHRMKANYSRLPRALVVSEPALSHADGQLTQRLRTAFEAAGEGPLAELVVVQGEQRLLGDAAFAGLPQRVRYIERPVPAARDDVLAELSAGPGEVMYVAAAPGDEWMAGLPGLVALETAPIEVVKSAQSVTYSAEREGVAEVLEAMLRLQK